MPYEAKVADGHEPASLALRSRRPYRVALFASGSLAACMWLAAGAAPPEQQNKQRDALARWQALVGDWQGVGQPRRGSAKDAWQEECSWMWNFAQQDVALAQKSTNGKYLRDARLKLGESAGQFELEGTTPAGTSIRFRGSPNEDGELVLVAKDAPADSPSRVSIRVVAGGDRMLILYERQAGDERYARLAEVGFTRKGSRFGQGSSFVECVVTGGVGTIAVMHEGKSYYVCCTGCRDYFNDKPAEVLAEYRARKEQEKAKGK